MAQCRLKDTPDTDCICRLVKPTVRRLISGETDLKKCSKAIEADEAKFSVTALPSNQRAIAELKRLAEGGSVRRSDGASTSAAPAATTVEDVVKKIGTGGTPTDEELKLVTGKYIEDLKESKNEVKLTVLRTLQGSSPEVSRIKAALVGSTSATPDSRPVRSDRGSSTFNRGGFFAGGGYGLSFTSASYSDTTTEGNPTAIDNSINTGPFGVGKSPSGNYPGHRFDAHVGYAFPVSTDVNVRSGLSLRLSKVQQGYENPQFGRSVSDMSQNSFLAFIGVEKEVAERLSVFADLMVGVTNNSFSDNSGTLQTSPLATQIAQLKRLEGNFLAGAVRVGAAYMVLPRLSIYTALSLHIDTTRADAVTEGGGRFSYGTKGVEATGTIGVEFR